MFIGDIPSTSKSVKRGAVKSSTISNTDIFDRSKSIQKRMKQRIDSSKRSDDFSVCLYVLTYDLVGNILCRCQFT